MNTPKYEDRKKILQKKLFQTYCTVTISTPGMIINRGFRNLCFTDVLHVLTRNLTALLASQIYETAHSHGILYTPERSNVQIGSLGSGKRNLLTGLKMTLKPKGYNNLEYLNLNTLKFHTPYRNFPL